MSYCQQCADLEARLAAAEKENQELRAKLDGIEEALQSGDGNIPLALRIIATSTMKEKSHE